MFANLALGSLVIGLTVLIYTLGLTLLSRGMVVLVNVLRLDAHGAGRHIAVVATVLSLFLILTVEVWLWAAVYVATGIIGDFQEALYFSTVTFSTVGYGDVTPPHEWRLFCSLEGVNGFLLIGWSTAYLVSASIRHGPFRIGEHF
jgi:hypothetical protein